MPSSELEQLKADRKRLRQEHAAGASGLSVVRAISDSTDRAILSIWSRLGGPEECALVAVGGYGRRELSPASDVDLVVLQGRRRSSGSEVKKLAYELWDGGLELGYALHTPKEALRLARERIDSATAFLDARFLAGDRALFDDWAAAVLAAAQKTAEGFIARLREATELRRKERGDAGAELEPNIKEGRGGLRDLTTIGWIRRLAGEANSPEGAERAAADFLHRVRNQLHFMTERRVDVLSMQHQPQVASELIVERGEVAGEDHLMKLLYQHARHVAFTLDSAFGSFDTRGRPVPGRADAFEAEIDASSTVWSEPALEIFLSILGSGAEGRRELEELEHRGLLVAALPEWDGIRCLPQRNVYHRWAVDVHSFEVVAALVELFDSGEDLAGRVAQETAADLHLLLLAGLFHDLGKGDSEDHAVRGERLARSALNRMGLSVEDAAEILFLVRHHLLLPEAAARRDVGDERFVLELAEKVGSERRLRMLYLLTVADAVATGPSAWGPWKATLVSRLFTRMMHALEQGELVGGDAAARAAESVEGLREALSAYPASEVEIHLTNMPRAWLVSQPFDALLKHSQLMLSPLEPGEIRLDASPQREEGIWEAVVVARDRPGLFSKISGSLALHGLNIVGADVYTREDGVALEIFRLEALGDEERRFERVVSDARKALRGRLSLDVRLAEKRRDYSWRSLKGKQEPPRVVVDNGSSDFYSVIEVHAPDRVGLLYTITRALADLELDIHQAKIATYGHDVVDVFYVRDLDGQKATDAEHMAEIERTILHRLGAEA